MSSPRFAAVILASASPRRRELLERAAVDFEVRPANVSERREPGEPPALFARRLALAKARAVARTAGARPPRLVLGADTIVVIDAEVLGKPTDAEHAVALLSRLLGRTHRVITAVALVESATQDARDAVVESTVRMRPASAEEVRAYVATGEPLDKAGAYAVQGLGRRFVEKIEGSESNVIGLPLEETLGLLSEAGWRAAP
jgi:septum formation protein